MSGRAPCRQVECFEAAGRLLEEAGSAPPLRTADALGMLQKVFWGVFGQLPRFVQGTLNDFWTQHTATCLDGVERPAPAQEVCPDPSGGTRKSALASTDGLFFRFRPDVLLRAPEDIVATLVAHEFAHAYVRALNWDLGDVEEEERQIPTIMRSWGDYRDDEIDLWVAEATASADLSAA